VDPSVLAERVESLASWVQDLDAQLRATATIARDPKTAKELTKALEAWSRHGPKLEESVTGRIELLAERVAVVADTANATAGALAGKQGEIAALRRDLEQSTARLEAAVRQAELTGSSAELLELRHAVAALTAERQARPREPLNDLMPEKADVLAERIDMLAKTVATTAAGLAGREGELATLRRSLDEAGGRFDAVVGGLRHSLDLLSAHVTGLDERTLDLAHTRELGTQVEELARSLDALTRRVDSIASGVDAAAATLGNREREFAAMHRHLAETSARIEAGLEELEAGLAALPPPGTVDPAVAARLDSLGRQLGTVTAHLAELEAATRATPSVEQALDAVDVRLAHLGDRVEAIEREGGASEVHADIERRLATFAARLEAVETDRDTDDATQLRGLVDDLQARLELTKREQDEVAASQDVGPGLESLGRRLQALERGAQSGLASGGLTGDGRYRVELRALELRLEHSELEAREGRDAVLTQLESVATRIEWRLQRLESAVSVTPAEPAVEEAPLGRLVPIRTEGMADAQGG
jgi:chromosome segregation ATPase